MVEKKSTIKSGKTAIGKVIKNSMKNTIVVEIESKLKHPLYGKYIKHYSKLYAHDSENVSRVGDLVEIKQTRPISKMKNWLLVQVIESTGA